MKYKQDLPETKQTKVKMEKEHLTKYEKAIYRPIKVITGLGIFLSVLNMVLPVVQGSIGMKSPFQLLMLYVYANGIFNARGLNIMYNIPVGSAIGIRLFEALFRLIPKTASLNWAVYFVLILLDVTFIAALFYHKMNYELEVEKYVK